MDKRFKVGIVGAGAIVESSHIPVLKVLPDISIEWIYDRDMSRAALISRMFHIPYIDGKDIPSDMDRIDICLLTIPYGARQEYIQMCGDKKKALYIEKPFSRSINEHNRYSNLFSAQDLAVGFQRRYYRIVDTLTKIVASNIFGKLKNIEFRQGYFTLKGNKEFLSNAALSGGGVIIESAIHTLDQLLLITGAKGVFMRELSSLQLNGIDYDTICYTELQNHTGTIGVTMEVSTLRNLQNGVRFHFEHAAIGCGMYPDEKLRIFDNAGRPMNLDLGVLNHFSSEQNHATSIVGSFYCFWSDFLEAVGTKTPNKTSAISSILTTDWIEQVYEKINQS